MTILRVARIPNQARRGKYDVPYESRAKADAAIKRFYGRRCYGAGGLKPGSWEQFTISDIISY